MVERMEMKIITIIIIQKKLFPRHMEHVHFVPNNNNRVFLYERVTTVALAMIILRY